MFYTLGRYDIAIIYEVPSEKDALIAGMTFVDKAATETMVAIPLEEARKSSKDETLISLFLSRKLRNAPARLSKIIIVRSQATVKTHLSFCTFLYH
jgi:hypothetical protein